jgi:membrane protein
VIGAHFNSAIQEMWPAKMTPRQRRHWRRLEMGKATERTKPEPTPEPEPEPKAEPEPPAEPKTT